MLSKLVLCYIPKSIIKIISTLKYFFLLKYSIAIGLTGLFDNLLVSRIYSVRVSIYLIICRKVSMFSCQKVKYFSTPGGIPYIKK